MRHIVVLIGRLAALLLVATATPTAATMLTPMPLERVARDAVRIVQGRVVDVRSGRDESGLAATWITLDIARSLKGTDAGRVTFKQYGTATPLPDGTVTRVAGLPRYATGEEVVLFLRGQSRRGFTSTVGFGQGTYRVKRTGRRARVRRDLPVEQDQDLDGFLSRVEQLAGTPP